MDFGKKDDCVRYFEHSVIPLLKFWLHNLQIDHQLGTNRALMTFEGSITYRRIEYNRIHIMVLPGHNRDVKSSNFPIVSGKLFTDDVNNEKWFLWDNLAEMFRRVTDLRDKWADEKVLYNMQYLLLKAVI